MDDMNKALMSRLQFNVSEDVERKPGQKRFTAYIMGIARADGDSASEACLALRARLMNDAESRNKLAETEAIKERALDGLVDIWTDLGKPDFGPEHEFVGALVAVCRVAIEALKHAAERRLKINGENQHPESASQ